MAGFEAASILWGTAMQLRCALEAVDQNGADCLHLFQRLRDNTSLVQAALQEGLSSSNAELNTAIENTIQRIVTTLAETRNVIYKWMLMNRMMRIRHAINIKGELDRVHTKLDRDLADLRSCISMDTWTRVVKGISHEPAGAGVCLPPETAEKLTQLAQLASSAQKVDKKVIKRVARVYVSPPKEQPAAVADLRTHLSTSIASAGCVFALVQLLASPEPAVQEAAAEALSSLASGSKDMQDAIVGSGGIPPLVRLLGSEEARVQRAVAGALGRVAFENPAPQAAITAAGGLEALVRLLSSASPGVQEAAAGALNRLASGNATTQAAVAASGANPILQRMLGRSSADAALRAPEPCAWPAGAVCSFPLPPIV